MSCAYRTHRYRASVTAHLASVSWNHVTGHPQHPISLRLPVVRPGRQVVMATADDAPIPVSLVQYLWAQWHQAPPEDRESVARTIGALMRSPRWHWDVTVLPDQSLPDPQGSFVSERDGRPTIGMPIAMLRTIWTQVVEDLERPSPTMPPIMQRFGSIADPALWQEFWKEFCALRNRVGRSTQRFLQWELYGYLSPQRLPKMAHEIRRLLQSNTRGDRYTALTVLTRWLESDDHETRTVAAQMLSGWPHVVAALVRSYPRGGSMPIHDVLDRLVPTILTATRPEDRVRWAAILWDLLTDSTLSNEYERPQMVATALQRHMMQEPMAAALVHAQLCTEPSLHRTLPASICDTLLAGLIQTAHADAVLTMVAQEIRRDPNAIARFDPILAAGWGHGHDQRILQIIDSLPGPHWETVLTEGITASVGAAVCDRIQAWFPPDQAMALIGKHIYAREELEDWPLAPLPAHLIPWVGAAARARPHRLHPTTVRRLWLTNPDRAWDATQTMLHSDDPFKQVCALEAMGTGWGTRYDAEVATTLRARILERQDDRDDIETGIATAVAGIGRAAPAIIEALLTELAMQGNENVQRQLIFALHRGWGRGQDALILRALATMDERGSSEQIWADAHETLRRAWDYLPPDVVVSLVDRLVTRATNRLAQDGPFSPLSPREVQQIIAAFAPSWTHLPTSQVIACIQRHVDHLCHLLSTPSPSMRYRFRLWEQHRLRDLFAFAWASAITSGAERLSASDVHALLSPLWNLSPQGCLDGICHGMLHR